MRLSAFCRRYIFILRSQVPALAGLVAAIVIVVFVISYIVFESSYDHFHSSADRIYAVHVNIKYESGRTSYSHSTSHLLYEYALRNIPGILKGTRTRNIRGNLLGENATVVSVNAMFADPSFFSIFDYGIISGNVSMSDHPDHLCITRSLAEKIYGDEDPLGETVEFDGRLYNVAAIVDDPVSNSNLSFDIVLPIENYIVDNDPGRNFLAVNTYLLTRETLTDSKPIENMLDRYYAEAGSRATRCKLVGIKELHQLNQATSQKYPVLIITGLLVLAMAMVNYINIVSAIHEDNQRSTGIRKIMGAGTSTLVCQSALESCITMFIASLAAFLISNMMTGVFGRLAGVPVKFFGRGLGLIEAILLAVVLLSGLVAGILPSLRYVRRGIRRLIAKGWYEGKRRIEPAKLFVLFQITVSMCVTVVLLIILMQLRYMDQRNPGFETCNRICVKLSRELFLKYDNLLAPLYDIPGIISVSGKTAPFGDHYGADIRAADKPGSEMIKSTGFCVRDGFFSTMGIELLEGNTFEQIPGRDSSLVIIDKQTAGLLGYESPVGKRIQNDYIDALIIGVVENTVLVPPRGEIRPVVFNQIKSYASVLLIYFNGDMESIIGRIAEVLRAFDPHYELNYNTVDEVYRQFYEPERRLTESLVIIMIFSLLISLAGVYSMVAYSLAQKTKQMSIRKVMGASVAVLIRLSLFAVLRLIIVAAIIAIPIAYLLAGRWLMDFQYRINPGIMPALLTFILICTIVILIIYQKEGKAARLNPVESLRMD